MKLENKKDIFKELKISNLINFEVIKNILFKIEFMKTFHNIKVLNQEKLRQLIIFTENIN